SKNAHRGTGAFSSRVRVLPRQSSFFLLSKNSQLSSVFCVLWPHPGGPMLGAPGEKPVRLFVLLLLAASASAQTIAANDLQPPLPRHICCTARGITGWNAGYRYAWAQWRLGPLLLTAVCCRAEICGGANRRSRPDLVFRLVAGDIRSQIARLAWAFFPLPAIS